MDIARNAAKERIILDALRASFSESRIGDAPHLSDLLKVRQAYWNRTLPLPPTDSAVLYFLAGRGHEEVFARLAGVQVGATEVKVVRVPEFVASNQKFSLGISYRPDFEWYGLPTEFKTRRSNLAKPGEEAVQYDNYLEQLKGYVALSATPSRAGHLIVFSLLEGRSNDPLNPTHPEIAVYDVQFSADEIVFMLQYLTDQRVAFEKSFVDKDHKPLPLCAAWLCGKNRKEIVKFAYCLECEKNIAHKPGHAHVLSGKSVAEEVKWHYEPRCPHYVFCRPQDVDLMRGAR